MTVVRGPVSKRNPLGLKIGEWVKAYAYSSIEYVDDKNKQVVRECHNSPISVQVTGIVRRGVGTYVSGYSGGYGWDPGEYEPPSLKVSRYVLFYECKRAIDSKPVLVLPDDIEIL